MTLRPIPRSKVPRLGRPHGRFTQHRRIDLLREKLESHTAGLTLDELAGVLRMTTRSVRRYLRELALVTELESIAVKPGGAHVWRIKPSERGRTVALRRTQAAAVLAARRVFDVLKGSALFDEIDVMMRDIEQVARRPQPRVPGRRPVPEGREAHLEERFACVPAVAHAYANRAEDMDEVFRGVAELRVVRFRYRERAEDKGARAPRKTARPYALVIHGGAVTCVAFDVERNEARPFAFDRMADVEASEERFDLPPDFVLTEWLHGDFGVAREARSVDLLVEFEPRAADAVRARRVHPSQKIATASDGRVRVSMRLPESSEVLAGARRWLLGFGATARVLEPRDMASEIAAELRRAAERYRT